jgi:hypothetical protein
LWLTPHAHVYEWTLLILPATIFWTDHPRQQAPLAFTFVAVGIVAAISVPLARAQIEEVGMAMHPAVPALLFASVAALRLARNQPLWPRPS